MTGTLDASAPVDAKLWAQLHTLLPTSQQTLFLRACLHEGQGAREAWNRWQHDAMRDGIPLTSALAPVSDFLPLLSWNLKRNDIGVDQHLGTHLRFAELSEEVRWPRYRAICGSAFGALRRAGIPFIALKGAALSELVYPTASLRHTNDIDVLLHRVDLESAATLLEQLGWRRSKEERFRNPKHLPSIVHPFGLPIELHERLLIPYYKLPYDHLWARSDRALVVGLDVRILSAADNLLHICAHGMSLRPILRWVPDAWFIIRRYPGLDWRAFLSTAVSARLGLPVHVVLHYLACQIGAPIPAVVLDELRSAAAGTRFFGRCAARVPMATWTSGTPREIWSRHGSYRRRLLALWQRTFPPPVDVALLYDMPLWKVPVFYLGRLLRYAGRLVRLTTVTRHRDAL